MFHGSVNKLPNKRVGLCCNALSRLPCKRLWLYVKVALKILVVAALGVVLLRRHVMLSNKINKQADDILSVHIREAEKRLNPSANSDDLCPQMGVPKLYDRLMIKMTPYNFATSPMAKELKVQYADCGKIIKGDQDEIDIAKNIEKENITVPREDFGYYMELRSGCPAFIKNHGYIMTPLTKEERNFPLAYSIVFYKNFHQFEEILRLIYRPQNFYCLHVDRKARDHMYESARLLSECFDNVVITLDRVLHREAGTDLITPDVICMYELLRFKKWKYLINLTGQEIPIKTNLEIVKFLKSLKGANEIKILEKKHQVNLQRRLPESRKPPHGIKIVRGESHIMVTRQFVEFVTTDEKVRDLYGYLNGTYAPEEAFWATLNVDKTINAPGRFTGTVDKAMEKPWFGRSKWHRNDNTNECSGFYVSNYCVYGVADLQHLVATKGLIANKFYWHDQPIARMCMHEYMFNRTRDEYLANVGHET